MLKKSICVFLRLPFLHEALTRTQGDMLAQGLTSAEDANAREDDEADNPSPAQADAEDAQGTKYSILKNGSIPMELLVQTPYFNTDHSEWTSPTFNEIHRKLYLADPTSDYHVVKNFSNPYSLQPTFKYPHSNLQHNFFSENIIQRLAYIPSFIQEK